MNAIEIADMLAGTSGDFIEASILIRRQHAEIQEWRNVFGFLGTPDELGNEWNALKDANSRQHEAITSLRKQLETEHTARLNVAAMRQKMCDEIEILRLECEVYRGIIADTENLK